MSRKYPKSNRSKHGTGQTAAPRRARATFEPETVREALDRMARKLAHLAADAADDSEPIDSGSIRQDGRGTVAGSEIIGHRTRASFMRATGRGRTRQGLRQPAPIPDGITAREAIDGLRRAWNVTAAAPEGLTQ